MFTDKLFFVFQSQEFPFNTFQMLKTFYRSEGYEVIDGDSICSIFLFDRDMSLVVKFYLIEDQEKYEKWKKEVCKEERCIVWICSTVKHAEIVNFFTERSAQHFKSFFNSIYDSFYIETILNRYKKVSIEQMATYLKYSSAVAKSNWEAFVLRMHQSLASKNYSIYDLSQTFLLRDERNFFAMWKILESLYGHEFWSSFFTDLIWAAIAYVDCKERGSQEFFPIHLKKKLPFSFINYDYKNVSLVSLKKHFSLIIFYDLSAKLNDGNSLYLEKFFFEWFR